MKMKNNKQLYWRICQVTAVMLMVTTFTTVVIPPGTFAPSILGMPYTLWLGILVSIILVILTYFATRFHPDSQKTDSE
ncbi:MAG: hypothetical protein CMO01_32850 [Thalassobius sp.]|nr:hypothetical protein [Thalassovita sp.]